MASIFMVDAISFLLVSFFLSHWTEVGKGPAFAIRTKNNTQLFLRLRRRPHSSARDKNIVPLAQFKTHLSRWVFVFISWEQWNESASQILEMTCRSWNSLTRMKCTAVHKDSFYFTICGAYHFKTALPSFQVRKANISFFPALLYNFRTSRSLQYWNHL